VRLARCSAQQGAVPCIVSQATALLPACRFLALAQGGDSLAAMLWGYLFSDLARRYWSRQLHQRNSQVVNDPQLSAFRSSVRLLVCGLSMGLLTGCDSSAEVRYKVTVEVEDHDVRRVGESVWSWALTKPSNPLTMPYKGKFEGDAVTVPLGDGRRIFALLRGADEQEGAAALLAERTFGDIGRALRGEPVRFGSDRVKDVTDIASRVGERHRLECKAEASICPMLVVFADPRVAASVSQLDPASFSQSLGSGVVLRGITVEVTRAPVTRTIQKELPWLADQSGALLKGSSAIPVGEMPLAARLHEGDFSQGTRK